MAISESDVACDYSQHIGPGEDGYEEMLERQRRAHLRRAARRAARKPGQAALSF